MGLDKFGRKQKSYNNDVNFYNSLVNKIKTIETESVDLKSKLNSIETISPSNLIDSSNLSCNCNCKSKEIIDKINDFKNEIDEFKNEINEFKNEILDKFGLIRLNEAKIKEDILDTIKDESTSLNSKFINLSDKIDNLIDENKKISEYSHENHLEVLREFQKVDKKCDHLITKTDLIYKNT